VLERGSRNLPEQSSKESELRRSSPLRTPNSAGATSLYLHGNGAPERSSSRVLEPHWSKFLSGNSAPERNTGLKRTRIGAILKKFIVKIMFKLKINLIWNTLNFCYLQLNHQ
jgi:hypothetical protein